MKLLNKAVLLTSMVAFLVGCVATAAQWMAYISVDPDHFNEVLKDADGNVVHISKNTDGLHITTFDDAGLISDDSVFTQELDDANGSFDLSNARLLVVGSDLASSVMIDATTKNIASLDTAILPTDSANWSISGAHLIADHLIAAFGSQENQGWVIIIDFDTNSSQLLQPSGATAVNSVFSNTNLVASINTANGVEVVSYDMTFNELGRFTLTNNDESLIGDSLGRPVLFNHDNHNVRTTDTNGQTLWEFENQEFEYIKGQSVGPKGNTLLWGDNSKFNPLSSVAEDKAHFLMISAEGELLYHYKGGDAMAKISYKNIKHFDSGTVQVSYQGWSGELTGFLIGSTISTPFTVTRKVYHDFISLKGNKTRWMREPKRVETYSQCGSFCLKLVTDIEGHCDNLDVFNVSKRSLISVSQICGAKHEDGSQAPNTVKVSLY